MDEWNFSPAIIAEAQEIGIGARVACHWSEAECQDQEGTVVGVEIHRRGKVEYTVHIDGDISPTDGFTHDIAGIEGGTIRLLSTSPALPAVDGGEMVEKLRMEAQGHAMEARAANATIHEIYQVISGATGEPGNWNGAEPVRQYVAAAEARVLSLEEEVKRLKDKYEPETKTFEFKGQCYTATEVIEKGFYGRDLRTIKVARAALKENGNG